MQRIRESLATVIKCWTVYYLGSRGWSGFKSRVWVKVMIAIHCLFTAAVSIASFFVKLRVGLAQVPCLMFFLNCNLLFFKLVLMLRHELLFSLISRRSTP